MISKNTSLLSAEMVFSDQYEPALQQNKTSTTWGNQNYVSYFFSQVEDQT